MRTLTLFLVVSSTLLPAQTVHAGANLAQQIEAAKRQRQAYYQQAARQKAIQEQQQAMRLQQQQAYQQQAVAAQQRVVQRQALNEFKAVQEAMLTDAIGRQIHNNVSAPRVQQVQDVVDISEIWKRFETSSKAWPLMMDVGPKEMTVSRYIDWYRQQGIYIRKPALHYVQTIDEMSAVHPGLLEKPFHEVLQIVAIVEYDFDNGMDRDQMAKQMLGQEAYLANKRRLGR